MKRVRRSDAAREVQASVLRMAEQHKALEDRWIERLEFAWWENLPYVVSGFRGAWRRKGANGLIGDQLWRTKMYRTAEANAVDAAGALSLTLDEVAITTIESVKVELQWCQASLNADARKADLWQAGEEGARAAWAPAMTRIMATYSREMEPTLVRLIEGTVKQLVMALAFEEGPSEIEERLFSPAKVSLPGSEARGVWWGPLGRFRSMGREASVRMADEVRDAAIAAFNEAGRG